MQDSMTKVSIRALFAIIGTIFKLVVLPLWLIYFLCVATVTGLQMFFAWLHNKDGMYRDAQLKWKNNTQAAFNFWKINV